MEEIDGKEIKEIEILGGSSALKAKYKDKEVILLQLPFYREDNTEKQQIFDKYFSEITQLSEKVLKIQHNNLIQYYGMTKTKPIYFLYEKFGYNENYTSLSHFLSLQTEKLLINKIIRIIFQLINSLNILHENEILHLNLNHENIFINKMTLQIKLIHFGIASKIEEMKNQSPISNQIQYCAPELLFDSNIASKASDIYSCAMIIFELITLKDPLQYYFDQLGGNRFNFLFKLLNRSIVIQLPINNNNNKNNENNNDNNENGDEIPDWIIELFNSASNFDPELRPTTIQILDQIRLHLPPDFESF